MEVSYNKEIYSKFALDEAIEAFKQLCSIELKQNSTHYLLTFSDLDEDDAQEIIGEFGNRALYNSAKE